MNFNFSHAPFETEGDRIILETIADDDHGHRNPNLNKPISESSNKPNKARNTMAPEEALLASSNQQPNHGNYNNNQLHTALYNHMANLNPLPSQILPMATIPPESHMSTLATTGERIPHDHNNNNNNQENESNPRNELSDYSRDIVNSILKMHTIGFFFFVFLLLYVKFDVSFYYAIVFLWLIDVYSLIASISRISNTQQIANIGLYIVNAVESFDAIVFKILLIVSTQVDQFLMMYSLIPLLIILIANLIIFLTKRKIQTSALVTFFFTIQMLNISLKHDEVVNWNWREVFWSFWVGFSLMIGITFALFLLLLTKCTSFLFANAHRYEIRGVCWLFSICFGITILSCLFIMALINYLDTTNSDTISSLSNVMYGIISYCLLIAIATVCYFRDIEKFFNKISSTTSIRTFSKGAEEKNEQKIDIPKFVLKISSTYFGRANNIDIKQIDGKANNKDPKKSLYFDVFQLAMKKKNFRTNSLDYSKFSKETENMSESYRETFHNLLTITSGRSKETIETDRLNDKINSIFSKPNLSLLPSPGKFPLSPRKQIEYRLSGLPLPSIREDEQTKQIKDSFIQNDFKACNGLRRTQSAIDLNRIRDESLINQNDEEMKNSKLQIVDSKNMVTSPNKIDASVTNCLICFDKQPDAVFMECGHGGVCYDCSLEVWKATNECYLCRKPITQILQLDLTNYGKSKVIKVLSSTQMVDCDADEKQEESESMDQENQA